MGHKASSVSKLGCKAALATHERAQERQAKRRKCLEESFQNVVASEHCAVQEEELGPEEKDKENADRTTDTLNECVNVETRTQTNFKRFTTIATQADLTLKDIEEVENFRRSQTSQNLLLSESWFQADDDRVRFYTGLLALTVLMAVFKLICPGLPERNSLRKFQQLIITLMKLKLNLPVQDIAYRFGVHASTVSRVFHTCVHTMFTGMSFLVQWPERDQLTFQYFKKKFSSCAVFFCFEVFVDRPSCLLARALTWSSYKQNNTAKFFIGITLEGTVSFISKG